MNKLFLVLSFLALFSFSVYARANPIEVRVSADYPIHNLNSGLNYTTIQQAIIAQETSNGHTIFIEHGTYVGGIVVNKSLSLIGEDPETTIIDGMGAPDRVIGITADNVSIAGFTIRNSNQSRWGGGIAMYHSKNCTIHANVIADNVNGIVLESSSENRITGNNITNSYFEGIWLQTSSNNTLMLNNIMTSRLQGIWLTDNSDYNRMAENFIANSQVGIELARSSNTNINNNSLVSNSQSGISLLSSSSNTISENTFVNDGLYIDFSFSDVPFSNEVVNNTVNGKPLVYLENESDYLVENAGQVVLVHCNRMQVENNDLSNCSVGIELWKTSNSEINVNNITGNEYGVLLDVSTNNTVCQNSISNSTYGIYGLYSSNNSLNENALVSDFYGIFSESARNDSVKGNNITNCSFGIMLFSSLNYQVYGNNIVNGLVGIDLYEASNNILRDNVLVNNSLGGFSIEGSAVDDFVNHVDTSNTINGKPIIYLINKQDLVIDPKVYPSIGYLAVVNSTNMTIEGFTLEHSTEGIILAWVTNSLVDNVTVVGNYNGISLIQSRSNAIEESIIMNNENGIVFLNSSINNVTSNSIMENQCGISVDAASSENRFFHNNFVGNREHVILGNLIMDFVHINYWDDGYPSGGNYWCGYTSSDIYSGQFQNETGLDWIGDSPYVVFQNNRDNYPLMKPFDAETQNVWVAYRNLLSQYNGMQSEFEALNLTTYEQQRSFNDLTTFLNSSLIVLQAQINSLNHTNASLNQVVTDLQGQLNSISSTLQTSLSQIKEQYDSLSYQTHIIISIFGAVIILLFAATIFSATRKPKTK